MPTPRAASHQPIALPMFVKEGASEIVKAAEAEAAGGKGDENKEVDVELYKKLYDFEKLRTISKIVTRNLNKVIDINYYPVAEAKNSNMRHHSCF